VPAPPRTSPTPAQRFGLISSLSRRPPCNAAMRLCPSESIRANTAWALRMVSSSTCLLRPSAAAQASDAVSRTMTCSLMPKETLRPRFAAAAFTVAIFSATAAVDSTSPDDPAARDARGARLPRDHAAERSEPVPKAPGSLSPKFVTASSPRPAFAAVGKFSDRPHHVALAQRTLLSKPRRCRHRGNRGRTFVQRLPLVAQSRPSQPGSFSTARPVDPRSSDLSDHQEGLQLGARLRVGKHPRFLAS
jgi:hypothetical protein